MNGRDRVRSLSRTVAGALIVVSGMTGVLAVATPASPAGADPLGACTTTAGEIVAVDFAPWGGNIERGCAATLSTGLAALQAAGFTSAGDQHDGPGFVCRIDDDPPPAQDPCINTPPDTAYWSYWHADAGQDAWSYSQLGAATYRPPPGSVDAWVFGSSNVQGTDGQPSFSPAQVRATNTTAVGLSTPTVPSTVPPTTIPSAPPVTAPPTTAPSSTPSTSTPPSRAPTTTTTTSPPAAPIAGKSGGSRSPEPRIVEASPVADKGPPAGSPLPFIVGGLVVVMMLGVAGFLSWRRRRPDPTVEG
jgi:hypothetical protein